MAILKNMVLVAVVALFVFGASTLAVSLNTGVSAQGNATGNQTGNMTDSSLTESGNISTLLVP
jgi:hypothetical protein